MTAHPMTAHPETAHPETAHPMTAYITIRHRLVVTMLALGALAPWSIAFGQQAPAPPPLAAAPEKIPKEAAAAPKPADSNDGRCDACGGCECVRKVCVPKPKEREIRKVCWSYKCEEFCIPGPSDLCGEKCQKDTCGCWWYDIWKPTWAAMHTRKIPVKTEVTRKVPGFEWTPEERCAACRGGRADTTCAAVARP